MLRVVEREGQRQHMLEVARHRRETVTVRHSVGIERDDDVGDDAADADGDPDAEQREHVVPHVFPGTARRAGQRVYDAAEQDRLEELQAGDGDVGQRQRDREAEFGTAKTEDAAVNGDEAHAAYPYILRRPWTGSARRRARRS